MKKTISLFVSGIAISYVIKTPSENTKLIIDFIAKGFL